MPEFMTKREACERLRISEQTLDRLFAAGRLRRIRVSDRRVVIPREDVDRLLTSGDQGAEGTGA